MIATLQLAEEFEGQLQCLRENTELHNIICTNNNNNNNKMQKDNNIK